MNLFLLFGLLTFLLIIYYLLLARAVFRASSVSFDKKAAEDYPQVSVLIAARNEAATIRRCLHSLTRLDYPPHRLQILIGNDQSTDDTAEVVSAFIKQLPATQQKSFQLLDIAPSRHPNLRGKANVLHQLMQHATGSFVFILDADTEAPVSWIKSYLHAYSPGVGIATGFTFADGKGLLGKLQSIDWTFAQTMLYAFFRMGRPLTALGNNMMVCPKAYRAVGGYENIPFHVTEDYALSHAIQKKGYRLLHIFSAEVSCRTLALDSWKALLKQRRRWIEGLFSLPLGIRAILALPMLWGIAGVALAFSMPLHVAEVWMVKWLLQSAIIAFAFRKLNYPLPSLFYFVAYELYAYVFHLLLLIYIVFQKEIEWKNRKYDTKRAATNR